MRCPYPTLFAFAVVLFTPFARGDTTPRRSITLETLDKARLEERLRDGGHWTLLCVGSCEALVVPEPLAEHRVVLDGDSVALTVTADGPTHYRATFPALPPRIAAAAITGAGYASASAGVFFLAVNATRPETSGRPRMPGEIDLRDTGLVLLGLGAVAVVVGGLWMLQAFRRPVVRVEQGASPVRVNLKLLPAPPPRKEAVSTLSGLEVTPPVATIVPLLGGTFL